MYNHYLDSMLRIFTTYLIVTDKSGWEQDWARYRKNRRYYFGYTKAQTIVFLSLIFISTFWPWIVAKAIYSLKIESSSLYLSVINLILGLIFFVVIYLIGFRKLFDVESDIKDEWDRLNKEKPL